MNAVSQALSNTPWWVYVLFVVLVRRGLAAGRANVSPLWRLAILPAVFAVWDLAGIAENRSVTAGALVAWLLPLLVGAWLGHWLVRRIALRADHENWLIGLDGDPTVLPLVLLIFAAKYALGYITGADPALSRDFLFLLADLAVGGFCTGIFVGRFATYLWKFRTAPSQVLVVPAGPPAAG
jgi:hypothetical protein